MWLWLRGGCPVCDMPAAQVQGGLGLSEMQAVPGLWGGEPLPEGKLLCHQWCRVRGLPARVRWTISLPRNYSIMFTQAFLFFPSKRECTLILTRTHLLSVHDFASQQSPLDSPCLCHARWQALVINKRNKRTNKGSVSRKSKEFLQINRKENMDKWTKEWTGNSQKRKNVWSRDHRKIVILTGDQEHANHNHSVLSTDICPAATRHCFR